MVLPSLILRLEQIARPVPARASLPTLADEPVVDVSAAEEPTVDEPIVVPEAAAVPKPAAEKPEPAFTRTAPAEIAASARRRAEIGTPDRPLTNASLSRWSAAVAAAHDACFALDRNGMVISMSVAAAGLLGLGDRTAIGRHVLDVIKLVDLETGADHPEYAPRITPLVVLEGPGLARSLMRVRHHDGAIVTLDTSSVPIHDYDANLLGSLSFLAPIPTP